jgi:hypothetical protein
VESGDILALIAAMAIVIIVALIANPPDFSKKPVPSGISAQPTETTLLPALSGTTSLGPTQTSLTDSDINKSYPPPYRIFYTDKPFTYPVYKMPANMETFGASEILWRNQEWVPFAFIEDSRGGLTNVFSVPYPVWVLNTTVISGKNPQYSSLRFVLCFADNGGIIEGEEMLNPGTSYRIIHTSNTRMYLIIATGSIDHFRIYLETPKMYYDAFTPPVTSKITGTY